MKRRMPSASRQGNGPLMTEHLRDLDLELELLKRKRSMIEQQQRMLSNNRQQPYQQDFDQGYQRNYANLYEDDHHRGQPAGSQFGQNYHSDAIWDHPAPQPPSIYPASQPAHYKYSDNRNNDRFANKKKPRRPNPWENPMPLLNAPIPAPVFGHSHPKLRPRGIPNKRKHDFKPAKVVKQTTTHSPVDTLKHQDPQSRRDLIKKAETLVTSRKSTSRLAEVFLPEVTPSNAVVGRMEFCLGTVLKDIRAKYGKSHSKIINDPNYLRIIKQVIRERVQEVMLGKVVAANHIVIEQYREKYPISTDKEIVDLCFDAETVQKHTKRVKQFLPEDNPERFFKINFHKLFYEQMDDMFSKIELLYKQQNKKQAEEIIKDLPDLTVDGLGCETNPNQDAEKTTNNGDISNGASENAGEQTTEPVTDEAVTETPANKESDEKEASEKTTDTVETSATATDSNTQESTMKGSNTENANETGPMEDKEIKQKEKMSSTQKTKFYLDLLDKLIQQRLPHFLKSRREEILKIMNIDQQFNLTRAAIIIETNKKAEKLAKLPVTETAKKRNNKNEKQQKPTSKADPKQIEKMQTELTEPSQNNQVAKKPQQLLYVKILAKPNLPETSVMKAFLDGFNPKLIKKPRTVPNLLIIGLTKQEDFDNILAANGTTVGNKKLFVTKSDKIKTKKNNANVDVENPVKVEINVDKSIISDDLDNQITDLLSSIRKAEEAETGENANNDSNPDVKLEKNEATIAVKPEPTIEETSATVKSAATTDGEDAVEEKVDKNVSEPETTKPNDSEQEPTKTNETEPEPSKLNENEPEETKPMETETAESIDKTADENVAKIVEVAGIQNQDTTVPSTPTRSSARITRSKLANQ